jgi:hypothetical protein
MDAIKQKVPVLAKTRKFVKKLVRETKHDPVLLQVARRTKAPNTHHQKKRAEIMKQGLAQLGILEHCIMLTETRVAMLTEYLDDAPKPTTKRRKKK